MTQDQSPPQTPNDDPFADLFDPKVPDPVYLDRSLIEAYSQCPYRGYVTEMGLCPDESLVAVEGTENHRIISEALDAYVRSRFPIKEWIDAEAAKSRPDVSTGVMDTLRRCAWSIQSEFQSRNPADVIGYQQPRDADGKLLQDDEHARLHDSQYAHELLPAMGSQGPVIVTSEIDVLIAGYSKTELFEIDWKRWAKYTASDILDDFQFRTHAWLLFNRPLVDPQTGEDIQLEQLHVKVWNLPKNQQTPFATFTKWDVARFQNVLEQAALTRAAVFAAGGLLDPEEALATRRADFWWGAVDKCAWCPARHDCPAALNPYAEFDDDPVQYLRDTQALQTMLDARKDFLVAKAAAKEVTTDEVCFGLLAPQKARRPTKSSYKFYKPLKPKEPKPEPVDEDAAIADMQKEMDEATAPAEEKPKAKKKKAAKKGGD